jgi:hypothetical protein
MTLAYLRLIGWENDVLISGRHPYLDMFNNPLTGDRAKRAREYFADGWCACFAGLQADLMQKVKDHRFDRNYMSNMLCEMDLSCRHI